MPLRLLTALSALVAVLALPGVAAADHPANFDAAVGPGTPGTSDGVEGMQWEPLATIATGNTHTDLDFFTQDGETYAAVGTLAAGPNDGGQAIVRLTNGGDVIEPAYVAAHPSASCLTDPSGSLGLQHDVEATPKGTVLLNETNPLADTRDAQLLLDASDAPGRCHDQGAGGLSGVPQGGLEIIDITDVANPVELALTSHIGESHTVNVDPKRPHIAFSVTSDAVGVAADADDCDGDGDTDELIRANECPEGEPMALDGFEIVDLSSCMDFPEGTSVEDKRAACQPETFRFRFGPLETQLGHSITTDVYGCHELEIYPDDRLTCGSGQALHVFDLSGAFDDNGTPADSTDDTVRGEPLPCAARASSTTTPVPPGLASGATVFDCVVGEDGADLTVPGWLAMGAPSVEGIEHEGSVFHSGRAATGEVPTPFGASADIDFDHEAELTHSGRYLLATDERGGGVVPPGATCSQGVDNPEGNGGIHAYHVDALTQTTPDTPEAAQAAYAVDPDGDRAIYRTSVQTPGEAAFCTAHVFHQIPGQNRIFMGWYSQGTRVVDYLEYPDGTFEWVETGYFIQPNTDQWVSAIFDVIDNGDGTFTYIGASADTLEGRGSIDVYQVTIPAPAQLTDQTPQDPDFARIAGTSGFADTAAEVAEELGAADTVVIGRDDDYADNLTGGVVAAQADAPLLYTAKDALSPATREAVQRLGATRAVIMGGTAAVSDAVLDELEDMGLTTERIAGPNRFATAQVAADRVGTATGTVYVAEGEHADPSRGFPDPIAAAAHAGRQGDAVLLVNRDRLPDETVAALTALGPTEVVIVGGTAAVSEATEGAIRDAGFTTRRLAGASRFGTSLAVVEESVATGASTARIWLATGGDWHDALAAAPVAASRGEVVALVDGENGEGDTSAEAYEAVADGLAQGRVVGDADSVSRSRVASLREEFIAITDPDAVALQAQRQAESASLFGGPDWVLAVSALLLLTASLRRRWSAQS